MNIFLPSSSVIESVIALDDKRVNKMSIETAQILSAAVRTLDPDTILPVYKLTHKNHPCVVWARNNMTNFSFTLNYLCALTEEFQIRFNKIHASSRLINYFKEFYKNYYNPVYPKYYGREIPRLDSFVNCTDFKDLEVHEAYRQCLINKWNTDKRKPKWTNRTIPNFYKGSIL